MNLPDLTLTHEFIPIPKPFRSSETGKPFSNCMVCDRYLLADGIAYMIEKALRQIPEMKVKEVIFEYAICAECAAKMQQALSVESRQRINQYFQEHTNLVNRRSQLLQTKSQRVASWINRCVIKGTPISQSREYQIMAQCDGKHLLFAYLPFALSMEAMDEMTSLLSEKSLREIDDFMGKYFTGPPEVSALLKRRLVLI